MQRQQEIFGNLLFVEGCLMRRGGEIREFTCSQQGRGRSKVLVLLELLVAGRSQEQVQEVVWRDNKEKVGNSHALG